MVFIFERFVVRYSTFRTLVRNTNFFLFYGEDQGYNIDY